MAELPPTMELDRLRARVDELERLDPSTALLGPILAVAPVILVRFDHQLRIRYVSRYVRGLSAAEVVGRPLVDFIEPSSREVSRSTIERVLHTGAPESYENSGPGPDGTLAHYHTTVLPVDDVDGTRGGCLVATDVTALKRRERAVAEGEGALQLALDATKMGLFNWELATGAVTWDARMREITGLQEPVTVAQYVERLVHPEDRAAVAQDSERITKGGRFERTHRIIRPTGEERWVLSVGGARMAPDGRLERVVGGLLDVTEHRRLEERLRESERLNAVGTLTAGVAHNFNNLLTVILPSLELLRPVVPASHASILQDCAGAAERAADLVHKLMTYAGKRPPRAPRPCDVASLVERVVALCERAFDQSIAVACTTQAQAVMVNADPADVEQVLMNLLLNARDAVSVPGIHKPRIEVQVGMREEEGGPYVEVVVNDNGPGMAPETLRRAGEPFFTTKGVGAGTGLGLATSSSIARDMGGRLDLESQPGQGTRVTLRVPSNPPAAPAPAPPVETPAVAGLRVLLVDDDPLVRGATTRVLQMKGHQVVCAEDGASALAAAAAAPFDVMLIDRSLPGESGAALVPRLRQLAPKARCYFFTGDELGREDAALVDGVVYKPVRTQELLAAVARR